MIYKYDKLTLTLEEQEVYWLWDIILFALDYDIENKKQKLTDEKRAFAKKLTDILDEFK
jgi:hypothetical protein